MSDQGNNDPSNLLLSDLPFGVKIEVSSEVPPDEVWFVGADGVKHFIENVQDISVEVRKKPC